MDKNLSCDRIGIIAGSRTLPKLFAVEARNFGCKTINAVAFHGETDPEIENFVDETVWIKVGQLGKLIKAFSDRNIPQCVMLGQIAPRNLFHVQPDIRGTSLLMKLKEKNAHTIFGAIADELEKDGVTLVSAAPWMKKYMPGVEFHMGRKLSDRDKSDAGFGGNIAKAVSKLEIGQTVVVKNGTVLAVEGFEGTDKCLERGGMLAGKKGGATAVKVAKENHDMRFDIPCIGLTTIQTCYENGIRNLAFEADRTLLLDMDQWENKLRKWDIALISQKA